MERHDASIKKKLDAVEKCLQDTKLYYCLLGEQTALKKAGLDEEMVLQVMRFERDPGSLEPIPDPKRLPAMKA